ncbi:CENP-Q, a CENPA-CAD centromere complex subunit-domain-containing protein [Xylariales sp. PMI_506]|nr:CENP-Q, a CENPA-CAD centromere complex subunit-domain-containing protein [Xylariales sp. PMI_506]
MAILTPPPNQKRKRGRPSNASKQDGGDAQQTQLTLTRNSAVSGPSRQDGDRPRKRTKPSPNQESELPKPEKRKAKRGRSPRSQQDDTTETVEEHAAQGQRPKKRGRPSPQRQSGSVAEPSAVGKARQRGRPAKESQAATGTAVEAEEADNEDEGNSSLLRRSARERRSTGDWFNVSPTAQAAEDSSPNRPNRSKKRGRSSLENAQTNERLGEAAASVPKKRGRPSPKSPPAQGKSPEPAYAERQKKRRGRPSVDSDQTAPAAAKKNRRKRKSQEQALESEEGQESPPAEEPRRRGRPRVSDKSRQSPEDQASSPSPEPAPYRHIAVRTRHITKETITEKWSPLEPGSISSVTSLLQSASRPVLLRLNNHQRHAQAVAALNAIRNRLRSKLARGLPFPPAGTAHRREDEFEYERTVDGIQSLEAQLDPLLHGVALLKKEKAKAERELEREYKILNDLSANARSAAKGRRDQLRKVHVLVPDVQRDENSSLDRRLKNLQLAEEGTGKTFVGLKDEELQGLAKQIGNHMESLRGNLQQIDGVIPAIAESRGALRVALASKLNTAAYENVLLG